MCIERQTAGATRGSDLCPTTEAAHIAPRAFKAQGTRPIESRRSLVSVILPVYNNCKFVGEALDSLLSQSFQDLEIIVIDDGSTDQTVSALEAYRDSIRLIETDHRGPPTARNRGIKQAAGEIIAFLDSDDIWRPEKLEGQLGYLRRHLEIGLVFCESRTFGRGHVQPPSQPDRWTRFGAPVETLFNSAPITLSSAIVRRKCLETVGLFDDKRASVNRLVAAQPLDNARLQR